MSDAWATRNSKVIYKNSWIQIHEDEIVRPNGSSGTYGVVKTRGGVGVVVTDKLHEIFLVAQYRYPTNTYSLEIPKGAFDAFDGSETPLDAARRELREETGITARRWEQMATVHTMMGYSDDTVHLFFASDVQVGESSPDAEEDLTCIRLPFSRITNAIKDGISIRGRLFHLSDATSIAGILMAKQHGYLR